MLQIKEDVVSEGQIRIGDDGIERIWNGRFWMCPEEVGCEYCAIWRVLHEVQQEAS